MYLLFSLFMACPEPPPAATTSTNRSQNTPNNMQSGGQQGGQPGGQPQGGQQPGGQPPGGQQPGGQQPGGQQPGGQPPQGGEKTHDDDAIKDRYGYPEANGEIIQDAIVIKINDSGNGDPPPQYTQAEVKDIANVTFSGKITCKGEDCDSSLFLRAVPFQEQSPTGKPSSEGGGIITVKKIKGIGNYSILLPKSKKAIVLELLVDTNGDTKPTTGERLAVLERGGQLIPFENSDSVNIDCSPVDSFGPIGGAVSPDAPAEKPFNNQVKKEQSTQEGQQPPQDGQQPPQDGQQPPQDGQQPPQDGQ